MTDHEKRINEMACQQRERREARAAQNRIKFAGLYECPTFRALLDMGAKVTAAEDFETGHKAGRFPGE